ncbi:dnaJ homolog subfamily C member 22 [Drosophila hydei]|uniref:DnaJ homolog subfamily C member 22 n=1 Tax=Drosophila hydei TaxID=7224 RepID=A0A6J1MHU3_DROHY|nr:dnaJ homolog subfamily C member 22 [Drosophila hydei]XP_023178674.2 dnaJ homolog subfamily C member 22 [Drosophila hydei]XP_023178675.2 dnaJ homolog subfamily C member 22 [Drosophila hydei]XP_023178676.2 dnaJ homolog subfamily C member 22 [Drosophila hydei]
MGQKRTLQHNNNNNCSSSTSSNGTSNICGSAAASGYESIVDSGSTAAPTKVKAHGHSKKYSEQNALPEKKSVVVAYILWLVGGIFGLHHLYLHRDRHAFLWWCSLGGYMGIGWFSEIFLIPEYVRDANEDPQFLKVFIAKLHAYPRPPYSSKRFMGQVMFGYLFGQLFSSAVPQTLTAGIDFSWMHWFIPIFVSLGVWTVGNIGRECGIWWPCYVGSLVAYLARFYIYDETYSLLLSALVSALIFDGFSKEWRRTPPRRRGATERTVKLGAAICIYFAVWGSVVVFNGSITDEDGGEMPIYEALQNFLASAWWTDLKQALHDTYIYGQHHGWYETWREVFESMDVDGERNAYKVLGVGATASQADITAAYRKLSKENHPDKVKDEALREAAHQRFIEIQQAYNVLSKIKSSRRRKNNKYNEDAAIKL